MLILSSQMTYQNRLCRADTDFMVCEVEDVEIKSDLFDIDDDKHPWPNGFFAKEVNVAWSIVKPKISNVVSMVNNMATLWRRGALLDKDLFLHICLSYVENKEGGGLEYHDRCNKLSLTYLSFAYDLMLFYNGDLRSLMIMEDILKEFSDVSGLS
ncbi:hypothetical protein OSB04_029358 [Centaurea solstitialis]|uniref:Uncharacterized protein n=1 Tax=Centaurea solstitialis TaxID=347529 RepID=A0AA38W1G7_9ASTR|nr:hypothetical protein OSB04_029358 [Centaurea solstitialis]